MADHYFFAGLDALEKGNLEEALIQFDLAADAGKGIKELFNNVGSALGEYGHAHPANRFFKQSAALDAHYALPRWNHLIMQAGTVLACLLGVTVPARRAIGRSRFL